MERMRSGRCWRGRRRSDCRDSAARRSTSAAVPDGSSGASPPTSRGSVGVDVSPGMVRAARDLVADRTNADGHGVNDARRPSRLRGRLLRPRPHPPRPPARSRDRDRVAARSLGELVRVTAPEGIASRPGAGRVPLAVDRLQPLRRAYAGCDASGSPRGAHPAHATAADAHDPAAAGARRGDASAARAARCSRAEPDEADGLRLPDAGPGSQVVSRDGVDSVSAAPRRARRASA